MVQSRSEKLNDIAGGAGNFEALHDDKQRGEKQKQFPIDAAKNRFRFDAADNQNECADRGGGERKRKIHDPQDEYEDRGERAFEQQRAIHVDRRESFVILRRGRGGWRRRDGHFQRGRVAKITAEEIGEENDVENEADGGDGSEAGEKFEEREMRGDADESVLRIAGDGHDRADVGGSGESDEIRHAREFQAIGESENDGSEHEADGVVDKKCGEDAGGENKKDEKLKTRARNGGDVDGDPVEEMRDLEVRDEDHDAEKENDGVPTDGAIGGVEGEDAEKNHGDGATKCRGGAVEMAAASGFDGDEDVSDGEDGEREPAAGGESVSGLEGQHEGESLTWFALDGQLAWG